MTPERLNQIIYELEAHKKETSNKFLSQLTMTYDDIYVCYAMETAILHLKYVSRFTDVEGGG